MPRRHARRGGGSGWWAASYGADSWPVVVREAHRPFRARLAPVRPASPPEPTGLRGILLLALAPAIDWLKSTAPFDGKPPAVAGDVPAEPAGPGPGPPTAAEPRWADYEPTETAEGLFRRVKDIVSGAASTRKSIALSRFNADVATWRRERPHRESVERAHRDAVVRHERLLAEHRSRRSALDAELASATDAFEKHRRAYDEQRLADEAAVASLLRRARAGSASGMEALARQLVLAMPLPIALPEGMEASFDPEGGILLLEVRIPDMARSGLFVRLKTRNRDATPREAQAAQDYVVHALPLRIMHEVFATPELATVGMVGVNLHLSHVDGRTGQTRDDVVGSLAATREEILALDVTNVDAHKCFRALKGVASPSFAEISPVRPALVLDRDDRRIVPARAVADGLAADTNLAAMDWEDFEHIVRELFARMFTARSSAAEVHVTRASRDYGVDALVHDPDPIHGGKFVIQAKRYVNTVDVAAVRDLFGTVQNEGANRGYLVTTSSFGPDAHAFARGKPITLVDGPHLLRLLREQGYAFRIDLGEARRLLHGR